MSVRVGVLADTHCPEFLEELPARVFEVLGGADLVIHAGDVDGQGTLDALSRIAPVEAVKGDHDKALKWLPPSRELTLAGKRIAVVHGDRSRWIEEPQTLLWTLSLGFYRPHKRLPEVLRRRFPQADVIVYGHTHRAQAETIDGVLLFNPGAVHQWNAQTTRRRLGKRIGWFEWCWLQVARHMRVHQRPSVGLLEIEGDRVVPSILEL